MAAIHPLGTTVVQRQSFPDWTAEDEESSLGRSPRASDQLIVAHDQRWLAALDHVALAQTRRVRRLNGQAVASADEGRWILATRTDEVPTPWITRLPFLRHRYRAQGEKTRLVLIEPETCRTVRASPWYRSLGSIAVSRDGRVLAASISGSKIQI